MRRGIIGLGMESSRRTYYPELQARLAQLEDTREGLRRSEENLRSLFDSMHDAVFIHDWEGRVLEVNEAMLAMYGVTRETFRDYSIAEYSALPELPGNARISVEDILHRLRTEGPQVFEWRARRPQRPDGDFDVEVSVRRVTWYDQDLVVAVVRDISERKRLEAMLRQSQKLDSLGQLAGGVAHDTNNMLSVIIGYTDILLEKVPENPDLRRDLEQIRKAAVHSANLTRQLLAFARQQAIQPTVVDLNALLDETRKMLTRLIGEQHTLTWTPAAGLWTVRVDPSQVDQILTNLVVNARDALAPGGTITLETANLTVDSAMAQAHADSEPGDYVRVSVSDTGQGMSPEVQARIFEPFFTTKELGRGTGLGLAMVYGIVLQNRGFITLESSPGQGTTFSVYLPRHLGVALPSAAIPQEAGPCGHESILLVEDEEALLELSRRILEGAGYRVLTTPSPIEALRMAREEGPALSLLATDVVMPGLNGSDLLQRIRGINPAIRCLFLSGYHSGTIELKHGTGTGSDFLQKPFTRLELLRKVRDLLDG